MSASSTSTAVPPKQQSSSPASNQPAADASAQQRTPSAPASKPANLAILNYAQVSQIPASCHFPVILTCVLDIGRRKDAIICGDPDTRPADALPATTTTLLKHPANTDNPSRQCPRSEFISEWNDASCGRRARRAETCDPADGSRRPQWPTESFSRLVLDLLIPSHAANGTSQCQAKYVWTRPVRPRVSLAEPTDSRQWTEFSVPRRFS